jgi:hypothetical protein
LVGLTDSDKIASLGLAKKITVNDVSQIASKVASFFGGYRWKRGQGCLSYMGLIPRYQGLEGWAVVPNRTEGKRLFTTILKVFDKRPDDASFHWSEATNPTLKYPKRKEAVTVINRTVALDEKRRIGELSTTGVLQQIVKNKTVIFK